MHKTRPKSKLSTSSNQKNQDFYSHDHDMNLHDSFNDCLVISTLNLSIKTWITFSGLLYFKTVSTKDKELLTYTFLTWHKKFLSLSVLHYSTASRRIRHCKRVKILSALST